MNFLCVALTTKDTNVTKEKDLKDENRNGNPSQL